MEGDRELMCVPRINILLLKRIEIEDYARAIHYNNHTIKELM